MNDKKILAIIIILALILRIIFALLVPAFEKPDEKAHFEYIQFVAENKKLPVQTKDNVHAEFFQPPFYHLPVSFFLNFVRLATDDITVQVISIRFISIFISMLTIYIVYKISLLLFKDSNLILGIVAFASFLPSYININSTVTNENLADLLATIMLYILLKLLTGKYNLKNIFALGIVAGISIITRLSMIPVIMAIPFAFIVKHYPEIKKAVKPVALIAIIALLISSWIFARNYALYGDALGINAMKLASAPDDIKVDSIFALRLVGWTFITFWASFGRTNGIFIGNLASAGGITAFASVYLLLFIFALSSFYGLYRFQKEYRKNKNILNSMQKKAFIIIIFHIILLALSFISFNLYDFQPQGRLFFSAISTIAIFFTFGIYNLFDHNNKNIFLYLYLLLFITLDIISIISIGYHFLW